MPALSNDFRRNRELASTLRRAADHADRCRPLSLMDAKSILLAALDDADMALDYGRPGAGVDAFLETMEQVNV